MECIKERVSVTECAHETSMGKNGELIYALGKLENPEETPHIVELKFWIEAGALDL